MGDIKPPVPAERRETVRQQIEAALHDAPLSAREISAAVGLPEKEVPSHLEHLRQTLRGGPERLQVIPATCRSCGFEFRKRARLSRPGRCPVCRSESVSEPRFVIE